MAKQFQFRRGTTSAHSGFTGAIGEITVDTDKNLAVVHDGSTAGGHPLQSGIYTNVKDFGAVGDGVANDTTAVEAALAEGGTVWFPEGDYLVDPCKIGVSNTHVLANGNASMIVVDDQQRAIFYIPTGVQYVVIEGLTLVGKNTAQIAGFGAAITINTNAGGTAWSNVPQDGHHKVLCCVIKGSIADTDGFNIAIANNKSNYLTFRDNYVENVIGNESGFGYGMTVSGTHIKVEDNTFFQSDSLSESISGRHGIYINYTCDNCFVNNNSIYNYFWAGIVIKGTRQTSPLVEEFRDMVVTNNYLENCNENNVAGSAAILINSVDNDGENPDARMIGVHVTGNTLKANFGAQIRMSACDQGEMRGNIAFDIASFGSPTHVQRSFEGVDCTETVFIGNVARDIPSESLHGMFLAQFRDGVVSNNVFQAATSLTGGINLNATTPNITDGNIIGPNKFIGTMTDRVDDDAFGAGGTANVKLFDHLQVRLSGFAPGAISAGSSATTTVTVDGAEPFDACLVTPQNVILGSNFFTFQARVDSADTVQFIIRNLGTTSQTPAVNNYFIDVFKRK